MTTAYSVAAKSPPPPSIRPLGAPRATTFLEAHTMSTDDKPERPREDDAEATPEWHRARAKRLRESGFTKMAEEHEQIAQAIERRRRHTL